MACSRVFGATKTLMKAAAKSSPASSAAAAKSSPAISVAATGIRKPIPVSAAMKEFVGSPEISRSQVIKKIWDYVKLHNLQNPTNKREIVCDAKLKTIFEGKDKVGMTEIPRLVGPHFLKSN